MSEKCQNIEYEFSADNPIESPLEDELGYSKFAYFLAKSIANFENLNSSYVIGVCGEWGDGKTSAINMALKYFDYLSKNPDMKKEKIDKKLETEKRIKEFCEQINKIKLTDIFFKSFFRSFDKNRIKLNYILSYILIFASIIFVYLVSDILTNKFLEIYSYNAYYKILFKLLPFIILLFLLEKFFIPTKNILLSNIDFSVLKNSISSIKEDFKEENYIKIWFDPWNYSKKDIILREFFKTLSEQIASQSDIAELKKAANLISQYAGIVLGKKLPLFSLSTNDKDICSLKNEISELLKTNNKKIIVIIDDLDRLLPKESLKIFQAVKMLADFPNIIYILSFDRTKICKDLKTKFQIDCDKYIEKIIQVEKNLPIINQDTIKKIFLNKIDSLLSDNKNYNKEELEFLYDFSLSREIKNFRDAYRLLNSLKFSYQGFKNESINPSDLIGITALEIFAPDLHKFVKENKYTFCSNYISESEQKIIHSSLDIETDLELFTSELQYVKNINLLSYLFSDLFKAIKGLEQDRPQNRFSKKEFSENLKTLISRIPNLEKMEYLKSAKVFTISNIKYFNNYFGFSLTPITLTSIELNELKNNVTDQISFKTTLLNIYSENPDKLAEFFHGYLFSDEAKSFRTKEYMSDLLKNLLCLGEQEKFLIKFLEGIDVFSKFTRELYKEFIDKESNQRIMTNDFYNLIQTSISSLNFNTWFFIYSILWYFKFPVDNQGEVKELNNTEKEFLSKTEDLLREYLKYDGFYENPKALSTLNYLYQYLNCEKFVKSFSIHILQTRKERELLNVLITGKNFDYNGYGFAKAFFEKLELINELKDRLLEIKFNPEFAELMQDKKYFIVDDFKEKHHIAFELLSHEIGYFDLNKNNPGVDVKEQEKFLEFFDDQIKNLNEKEIKFTIENTISKNGWEGIFKEKIKNIKKIKDENQELYSKYSDKLDLLLEYVN